MHASSVLASGDLLDQVYNSLVEKVPPKAKPNFRSFSRKLQETIKLKNKLRQSLPTSFPKFLELLRKITAIKKLIIKYRVEHDFWALAQEISKGSSINRVECSIQSALDHFKKTYSNITTPRPTPLQSREEFEPLSPLTLPISIGDIEQALRDVNLDSAPGADKICYGDFLNNIQCIPVLCELYNHILDTSAPPGPTTGWSSATTSLIFKNKGRRDDVANYRPIAVTSTITRLLHRILAYRLEEHLRTAHFFDEQVQKGFLRGLHGTLDHSFVLHEIVNVALEADSNVYVTLFDLKDAFGSIPHTLIRDTLINCNLPLNFINYIINYYNQTEASLKGPWGISTSFPINQGVLQGDPLSPLIFSACFNSSIKAMSSASQEFRCGNAPSFLAYADDTVLITNSAESHQYLTNLFQTKTREIGLTIRADKCVSWCVTNKEIGSFTVEIGGDSSRSLSFKPEKYLGVLHSIGGKENTSELYFKEFKTKCNRILKYKNINRSIRANIFQRYLLPSQYYSFMTSDILSATLKKLNILQNKFIIDQPLIPINLIYHRLQILSYIFKLHSDPPVRNAVALKQTREPDNNDIKLAIMISSSTSSLHKSKSIFSKIFKFDPKIVEEYPEDA